jgi:polyisoprenyl-phosphate glycosyltransferase
MIDLSVIVPVFNEEDTLPLLKETLDKLFPQIRSRFRQKTSSERPPVTEVLFVNDGSTDQTRVLLESFVQQSPNYRYINLSRNFGHQAALSAGLKAAKGNAVVLMDSDLQDSPELLTDMIARWNEGNDIVYAVKRKREGSGLKRVAYKLYYLINSWISDFPIQKDAGDFSLLDRRIVDIINRFPEKERYLRGLRAWIGFKQAQIEYDRPERKKGKSKYSFSKLFKLAFHGLTSTSIKPLFLSGIFCALAGLLILGLISFAIISKLVIPEEAMPKGWTSLMITISVLGGCQLMSIWLTSLYLSRMYREILSRPSYLVDYDSDGSSVWTN